MNNFKKLIFNLINNTIRISGNKNSIKFLSIVSFLESILFPIPPDIFLIPIVLAKKYKWLYLGLVCTFFSILGGSIGYLIGYFFWDLIGSQISNFYNANDEIETLRVQFSKYGWFIIFIAGFTPIPYKFFTLGSGLLSFNFLIFLLCSLISRGLRFITLAYLVNRYGDKSIKLVKKHFVKITLATFLIATVVFCFFIIK
jgi:membrane protein YqaA with SNARE-associated domain